MWRVMNHCDKDENCMQNMVFVQFLLHAYWIDGSVCNG